MGNIRFIRLAEVVNKKQDKRVVSVTVVPTITDCSGTIYFTDLQLQEGSALTGYAPHTEICLKESENAPVWFNGIVRSEETVILLNLGGTVTLAQGVGGQKAVFPNAMNAGDDVALLASTRECTRNGVKETKDGFYQYSAAWDSKHIVSLPQGKSAQLLYSMQEMDDGGELL